MTDGEGGPVSAVFAAANTVVLPDDISIFKRLTIDGPGKRNRVEVALPRLAVSLRINMMGDDNEVVIGADNAIGDVRITCFGRNGRVAIGRNNNLRQVFIINREGQASVEIGDDNLFSIGIEMRTSDSHKIIDLASGKRINQPTSIRLGNHNWLGQGVIALKGAVIGNDCIVGTRSVLTGTFGSNVVIAGVPCRVVREGVTWRT